MVNYKEDSEYKGKHSHNNKGHSHDHFHDLENMKGNSNVRKALSIAIFLNIGFVIAEVAFGFAYNSTSLLSDAVHNLGDVFSLALSWLAVRLLRYPQTSKHTYGMKKGTIIASLANAVVLLVTVGFIFKESIARLYDTQPAQGLGITIVASVGVVINGISAWLLIRYQKKDLNIKGAYLHLVSDALVSVGVVIGGIVIMLTDWFIIDALLGIAIACVILLSTWNLLKRSLNLALDAVPEGINLTELYDAMANVDNVVSTHHLHVWSLSTTQAALTSHVVISDFALLEQTKIAIKESLHKLNIQHITLEFEAEGAICCDED